MRMFFALWPDALTRAQVANAAAVLRLTSAARPVPQQNYHLTLAFVGEVPSSRLAVLRQIGLSQRRSHCLAHRGASAPPQNAGNLLRKG